MKHAARTLFKPALLAALSGTVAAPALAYEEVCTYSYLVTIRDVSTGEIRSESLFGGQSVGHGDRMQEAYRKASRRLGLCFDQYVLHMLENGELADFSPSQCFGEITSDYPEEDGLDLGRWPSAAVTWAIGIDLAVEACGEGAPGPFEFGIEVYEPVNGLGCGGVHSARNPQHVEASPVTCDDR